MWNTSREAPTGSAPLSTFPSASSDSSSSLPLCPLPRSESPLMSYELYAENVDYQQENYCHTRMTSSSSTSTAWDSNMGGSWYNSFQVNIESRRIGMVERVARKVASVPIKYLKGSNWVSGSREPATADISCAEKISEQPTHQLSMADDAYQSSYSAPTPAPPPQPRPQHMVGAYPQVPSQPPPKRTMSQLEYWQSQQEPSGVDWRLGYSGIQCFMHAHQSLEPDIQRRMYIGSVMALLKALPPDLNTSEMQDIWQSLPPTLKGPNGPPQAATSAPVSRNWVYSVTLLMLNLIATLYLWIAPIVQRWTTELARLEKEHGYLRSAGCSTFDLSKTLSMKVISLFPDQAVLWAASYIAQGLAGATSEFYKQQQEASMRSQQKMEQEDNRDNSQSRFREQLQQQRP